MAYFSIVEEKSGPRKDLMGKLIHTWMDAAEKIKMFLDVQSLKTEDTSVKEEETVKNYFDTGNDTSQFVYLLI